LAGRLRGYLKPRDRAVDVRMPEVRGNQRRIFNENVHSAGDRPICLGELPALGAAVTPGESTEQSTANPFKRGTGASE
jgi:hypothetical protein